VPEERLTKVRVYIPWGCTRTIWSCGPTFFCCGTTWVQPTPTAININPPPPSQLRRRHRSLLPPLHQHPPPLDNTANCRKQTASGPNDYRCCLGPGNVFLMFFFHLTNLLFYFLGSNYILTTRWHQNGTHTHACKPLLAGW
jgi:hypothetical protein